MSDFQPLGKAIPPKPAEKKPDVIERIAPGVIKRNGKLETDKPLPPPAPLPDVYIFTPGTWDAVIKSLRKQVDDGFPLNEFGSM